MTNSLLKARQSYQPQLPKCLKNLSQVVFETGAETTSLADSAEIQKLFPHLFGQPLVSVTKGEHPAFGPLRVGVVLSGGQASGGHNVITGLFDALKQMDHDSELHGFLNGPSGIIDHKSTLLTAEKLDDYRNQGGFDLIGAGRTKIETPEQLQKSMETIQAMELDGLVIIGGDDSNTNAAILAEYFKAHGCEAKVVGVPKTIDGDLKNDQIEISFGFDTATKTYSEALGNIARDCLSAKKYTHFVKLMGRSASHIALECALKVHPNVTLISEEVQKKCMTLHQVTTYVTDIIQSRSEAGKDYGIVLVPEGLIEFIPEVKQLIAELNEQLASGDTLNLSPASKQAYSSLPEGIQKQLLLDRDPHGNVQVSHINTESLVAEMVQSELKKREFKGKFSPVLHFFGYEGRAGLPTNFDATYTYALGHVAALLINHGYSGYMAAVQNLKAHSSEWVIKGVPITSMLNMEVRKGKSKPVIKKALVDLDGALFQAFAAQRDAWALEDHYNYPGPIQFFGDPAITDTIPLSLDA
ncbi:MAG: diphosphate--fructose-6-phosphate 1-phosphotransferase [Chlamydiia bacterium]|nr:diphosphate--fructose-6-phosphate 1-phosphotransferase [Chlamydiia bacterium]